MTGDSPVTAAFADAMALSAFTFAVKPSATSMSHAGVRYQVNM
jgi:hypothetical protein